MSSNALVSRMKREIRQLQEFPGPGISAWLERDDDMLHLQAAIIGPQASPFEGGTFYLSIQLSNQYPFEPPLVRFETPVYHPNIDSEGRICLDLLKTEWTPSANINNMLLTIRMLMESPNGADGLVADITEEFNRDVNLWRRKAEQFTQKHAMGVTGKENISTIFYDSTSLDSHAISNSAGTTASSPVTNEKIGLKSSASSDQPPRAPTERVEEANLSNIMSIFDVNYENFDISDTCSDDLNGWASIIESRRMQRLFSSMHGSKRLKF